MFLFNWQDSLSLKKFCYIIIENGTVVFVFIAGYLFQHLSYKYQTKKYLLTKFQQIIVPYLITSIPAILFFVFFQQKEIYKVPAGFYDHSQLQQIFLFYLTGAHLSPMWFIPMISLFYLSAPILYKADKTRLFYCLLPLFLYVSTQFGRGLVYNSCLYFFSAYVFGMFCSRYKTTINPILTNSLALAMLFLIYIGFAIIEYMHFINPVRYWNLFQKLTLSLILIAYFLRHKEFSNHKIIKRLAHTSFGIYFLHPYVLYLFKIIIPQLNGGLIPANVIALLFFTSVVILLSMAFGLLIEHIFKNASRFIIGSKKMVNG